jgi:predicted porin
VVGAKTDIWDYDMIAQAPGNGINGDYDGSYRSRNMLKYKKTAGDVDLYASYLFEDNEYLPGNGLRYKRKGGGSVGVDYHITKDLTWGPRGTTPVPRCATRQQQTTKPMIRISSVRR